jgi:hypothetical protein
VQEETTILDVPCLTMRPNTERPITITHGTNRLVTPDELADAALAILDGRDRPSPPTARRCGTAAPASAARSQIVDFLAAPGRARGRRERTAGGADPARWASARPRLPALVWQRREFAYNLASGQFRSQHMDTLLGNLWQLINPILLIAIYYLVFGFLLGNLGGDAAGPRELHRVPVGRRVRLQLPAAVDHRRGVVDHRQRRPHPVAAVPPRGPAGQHRASRRCSGSARRSW